MLCDFCGREAIAEYAGLSLCDDYTIEGVNDYE